MTRDNQSTATATPIAQGTLARVVQGVRYMLTGETPDAWFGPQQPMKPVVPEAQKPSVEGRQFDYRVGINLSSRPRQDEPISFAEMRQLADACDVLRLVIETRKDQLSKLKWQIKPKDDKAQADDRCKAITEFFQSPDREHTWDDWLRMLLEDLLVIDAPTIYPRMTNGGQLYALEPVDGSTIKRVLDAFGRTPAAPDPAYQQILKGVPAVDYSRDELIYKPRNLRTHKVYGYSPVEQIIITVNIALRRQANQLSYYTEGNIPNLIFGVPESWNPDQIQQFQNWWDLLTAGESKHKTKFVPGGITPHDTKPATLKDEFDEWLARIVCFAFSINPTPFIKQQNRATADNAHQQALEEGLAPIQNWIKSLIDGVILRYFGAADLEFCWAEEEAQDPLIQAQVAQIYVAAKVMHPDEVRADLGLPPLTPEQKEDMTPPPPPSMFGGGFGGDKPDDKQKPEAKDDKAAPEVAAEKLGKSASSLDRHAAVTAADALATLTKKLFAAKLPGIAKQIADAAGLAKAERRGEVRGPAKADAIIANLNLSDWADDYFDDAADILTGLAVDAGGSALTQLGMFDDGVTELMRANATEWANQRAAEMVGMKWVDDELIPNPDAKWQITEGTRDMIRDLTQQALDEGWSTDELADELQDSYAFSDARAQTIARTETARADTQGAVEGWTASGVVEGKQWLTAPDCCDECHEIDGEVVELGEQFSVGDDPPLHPNCRCAVLPVLSDEMDQETTQ